MTPAVLGIRAKLARALELLIEVDGVVSAYLDEEPLHVLRAQSQDGHSVALMVHQRHPPPTQVSVLIGEVVHQTRSSLDHLASALVRAAGNEPTTRTSFPISSRPEPVAVAGGVAPKALDIINGVQPARAPRPTDHPLWVLNALWNYDKHRALATSALALRGSQAFLSDPVSGAMVGGQLKAGPLRHGDVIAIFPFDGPVDPATEVEASGYTFVALADEGPWDRDRAMTEVLLELHDYTVRQVVDRLIPLLD